MTNILHLDSSPRGGRSISRTLSHEFIADLQAAHADLTITYRDLGHHPVPLVDENWIAAAYSPADTHTPEQAAAIRVSDELVDEFLAADRYVVAVPMYNFSIPANFKAYIDQIVRVGRTFSVDATGYQGLVHNKKMTIITAQGGAYPEGHNDLQTPYLKLIFGFIGITDIEFVRADSLSMGDEARERAISDAQSSLKTAISHW
jgi:FMN-dependent NADH-azoreductase